MLVLGQLTGDRMHHSTIVEDYQIAFLPTMGIYVLRRIDSLLESIHNFLDFLDVVNYGDLASLGIFGG